jgi:excisionase family DNA binding protein
MASPAIAGTTLLGNYLTTHQIAKLLGFSERTVANWIDRGHLLAFRTPGGHRRVDPGELRNFLRGRGMPIPRELADDFRVLIVEDDPLVARTLKGYLDSSGAGYQVTTVRDGVSALIHIGSTKPHLVILDILMPGMDGLEVCRKIRSNALLKDVRVLFLTGYSGVDPDAVRADTGACGVVLKPVRGDEFCGLVDQALGLGIPGSPA